MIRELFLFIKRMLIVASAIFFVNSIVFARGDGMGKLLFSGGHSQLLEFSFDGGGIAELAKISGHGGISGNYYVNLEKIDNDRFLFQASSGNVGIYSIGSLQEKILFEQGRCPTYFEGSGEVLFEKIDKTAHGYESYLYLSNLDGAKPVALKKIPLGVGSKCPIKLNGDEALVFLSYEANGLFLFNVKDRTFSKKNMLCEPVFGLSDSKLLCLSDGSYFIADYEGKKLKDIGSDLINKNNMLPMANLNEINSILILECIYTFFSGLRVKLWILDLGTLEKRLVVKGTTVNKKGAIYLNH